MTLISKSAAIILIGLFVTANNLLFINAFGKIHMNNNLVLSGDASIDSVKLIFSKGIPLVYGNELGIRYDFDLRDQNMMNSTMAKMATYDRGIKTIKVESLPAEIKKRYIAITTKISCEFCCGAKQITYPSGEAACGCEHSAAMRGLALYLLKYHPTEFSDEKIMQELARWKALYFPKQMMKKYVQQTATGNYTPDISGLIFGAKFTGEKTNIPTDFSIESLPDMAGGC